MFDLSETQQKMQKALEIIRGDLQTIRTGRATPALVENVVVSVYGGTQKLKILELGTITTSDSRTIVIMPFDPSIIEEINKGLQVANIGLTPVLDGEVIRISIPSLTEERRQEYLKLAKQKLEMGRIMIRQVRHQAMDEIKKMAGGKTCLPAGREISEDEQKRLEKDLQEKTDSKMTEIDEIGRLKEQELLQI